MTPAIVHLPLAAQPVMPWANGGGSTRQVAIDPPDGSLARGFRWRVSVAQVGRDGPFSAMPGVDRSLWLRRGAGFRLDVDGREVVLARAGQRVDFAGETPITCRLLAGPCEDVNVMVARGEVRAAAAWVEVGAAAAVGLPTAGQRVVLVLAGRCVRGDGGPELAAGDALRLAPGATVEVAAGPGGATVLVAAFLAAR